MKGGTGNGVVIVAIGLILILLLFIGGVGAYFFVWRQQMAMAIEADRARAAAAEARMLAEHVRKQAEVEMALNRASNAEESSTGQGNAIRTAVEPSITAVW